jgi:Zn-dependent peptidase ImmA (M78 family)/transcriptional regulator with XRE-family HTH domain
MTVTAEELGRRLRVAREACRLTQEEVAEEMGVSRATVTQTELGNRTVSSIELDHFAHLYGRDIREFLASAFRDRDVLSALFRAEEDARAQRQMLKRVRECMELGRELTNLERLLGIDRDLSAAATYPMGAPRNRWDAIQQGQRIADDERRRLGLGWAPAPELTNLLETQGVRTGLVDLPDDISGLTLTDADVGLFIVVNRGHHIWRRRFSFAHEYAHVLFDREALGMVSRSSRRDDLLEVRANAFGASFLMPERGVREYVAALGKGKPSRANAKVFDGADALAAEGRAQPGTQEIQLYDVVQLAHHFGVSAIAALYRLRNLRLITDPQLERLKEQDCDGLAGHIAKLLELSEPKHDEARNWFRRRVLGMALEAYRREAITRSKLGELAAMVAAPGDELERLLPEIDLDGSDEADVLLPEQ